MIPTQSMHCIVHLIGYNSGDTTFHVESETSTLLNFGYWERKFHGTKVPENKSTREQKFHLSVGMKVP